MTGVFIGKGEDTLDRGRWPSDIEAEIGEMHLQVKECQGLPLPTEAKNRATISQD